MFAGSFLLEALEETAAGAVLVGLVPDGYRAVEWRGSARPVRGNVFLLRGVRLGEAVTVSGPAGTRTVRYGGRTRQRPISNRIVLSDRRRP